MTYERKKIDFSQFCDKIILNKLTSANQDLCAITILKDRELGIVKIIPPIQGN